MNELDSATNPSEPTDTMAALRELQSQYRTSQADEEVSEPSENDEVVEGVETQSADEDVVEGHEGTTETVEESSLEKAKRLAKERNYEREWRAAQKKAETLEAQFSKLKGGSLVEKLEALGVDPEEIAMQMLSGDLKKGDVKPKDELALLKQEVEAMKAEKLRASQEKADAEDREYIAGYIEKHADEYPYMSSANPAGVSQLVMTLVNDHRRQFSSEPDRDELKDIFSAAERIIEADTQPVFKSERALKRLLADESIKSTLKKLLGIEETVSPSAPSESQKKGSLAMVRSVPKSTASSAPANRGTPAKTIDTLSELKNVQNALRRRSAD